MINVLHDWFLLRSFMPDEIISTRKLQTWRWFWFMNDIFACFNVPLAHPFREPSHAILALYVLILILVVEIF